jgi:flavorubredoxin
MKKVLVLYYSRSGNTEKMANAVSEGAQSVGGIGVELNFHVDVSDLKDYDAVIVGAPTYRNEMPVDFKNLFEEAEKESINLKGKIGAAFGSYGWSGEAPKLVLNLMQKFEMQITEPPILAKYAPDQAAIEACKNLGKRISESLIKQV